MEPEDLLRHSQKPVTCRYPEPEQSIPCLCIPVLEWDIKPIKDAIKKYICSFVMLNELCHHGLAIPQTEDTAARYAGYLRID